MSEDEDGGMSAAQAHQFARTYVIKSVIRTAIWVSLAAAITWFFPTAQWLWYVVIVFVAIAVCFAGASFYVAWKLERIERLQRDDTAA